MPQKLETVLKHVEEIGNDANRQLIKDYYKYLVSRDTSTNYQKDNSESNVQSQSIINS
jgi:hypothetical protein